MTRAAVFLSAVTSLFAGVLIVGSLPANAAPVSLQPYINDELGNLTRGDLYPPPPGPLNVGGVNFMLATGVGGTAGFIQGGEGTSVSIDVNAAGASTVHILLNNIFGPTFNIGETIGSLVFHGQTSGDFVYDIVLGKNSRDHIASVFVNTATDIAATATFADADDAVWLDRYTFTLPASFSTDILEYVLFNSTPPGDDIIGGAPFLVAMNIDSGTAETPLPAALPLFAAGLGVIGLMARRRKQKVVAT